MLRAVEIDLDFGSLVILLGLEVDHARDRVGAVLRRGAFPQHLDLIDGRERNTAQVDRVAGVGIVGQPLAVEEDQRAAAAEVPEVRVRTAAENEPTDEAMLIAGALAAS